MSDALRERALRMLGRRDYARQELAHKLAVHAGSAAQLDALLDDLGRSALLSDERYAAGRVHSRGARIGDAKLAHELRAKGVAADLVKAALATGEDELLRARRVWERKFSRQPAAVDDLEGTVARNRQMRFLAGRGFSRETIRRVLRGDLEND
ncbi:regulatory protein RecX [Accumulibacter sp.]|uniref:regulatory protein RecX n=1 Tax=Accumulibacter sp. TaxID=2053492 RepID=UPI001D7DC797|nr:regulatory protein RecX [Accumulibacter sp.]MCB1933834.1 regulatory protein RecX [Accumulibacter sp.]MCB1965593.1 regulatory protein RecX [Accumulibacter sp.]MCP5227820.1 regulatory protein RecX [Accumulibacter sp.]